MKYVVTVINSVIVNIKCPTTIFCIYIYIYRERERERVLSPNGILLHLLLLFLSFCFMLNFGFVLIGRYTSLRYISPSFVYGTVVECFLCVNNFSFVVSLFANLFTANLKTH